MEKKNNVFINIYILYTTFIFIIFETQTIDKRFYLPNALTNERATFK